MRFSDDEHRQWFNSQPRKPMSAAVLFQDTAQRVLLLKPTYRDNWSLPGGVVNEHESPLDGAVREVKEELSLSIDRSNLLLSAVDYRPARGDLVDKLYFYFYGGVLSNQKISSIILQSEEIEEMRFVTVDEAKILLSKWTLRQVSVSLQQSGKSGVYLERGELVEGQR